MKSDAHVESQRFRCLGGLALYADSLWNGSLSFAQGSLAAIAVQFPGRCCHWACLPQFLLICIEY